MFMVYNYKFDHSSDFDPKYTEVETLEEVREEAKRRLGFVPFQNYRCRGGSGKPGEAFAAPAGLFRGPLPVTG